MTRSTKTNAPERISVDFNGNKTASVISDVPEILGTLEYIRADLAPQWQPIETAPKDGTGFTYFQKLPFGQHWIGSAVCYYGKFLHVQWNGNEGEWVCISPSYWMPLPTPPGQQILGTLEYVLTDLAPQWQDIETAPKDDLIDIWLKDGVRWCDCYYDRICSEWRTSRPSGHLVRINESHVTHWMPLPTPPEPK